MSVERKTYTYSVEYWSCGCCDRKHTTRQAAQQCHDRNERNSKNSEKAKRALQSARERQVAALNKWVECGVYSEAARASGITPAYMRDLVYRLNMYPLKRTITKASGKWGYPLDTILAVRKKWAENNPPQEEYSLYK